MIRSVSPLAVLLLAALWASPRPLEAQTPAAASPGGLTERPRLLHKVQPRYPPQAWDQDIEGDVVLLLQVDEKGKVESGEVVSTPGHEMEIAALVAAKELRFSPARLDGRPIKVRIRYTFRFRKAEKGVTALPPERAPEGWRPPDLRPKGTLTGRILERGTGKPLARVEVYLLDLDSAVLTDDQGYFTTMVSPGGYAITIHAPGHHPFQAVERVESARLVEVKYYVERRRGARYRTIVWGSEGKAVVGRTSLAGAEIHEVPGTLGDPIRVVMLMPGVTTSMTGMGYPVVRGALPGDTRYEVDGVQVPMLYHLLLGNSVVNPRFTSGILFQPGGYSVQHGQSPGALIRAAPPEEPEERSTFVDLSILHTSVFHAQPVGDDLTLMLAGRYGTLGLIIEGIASNMVFRYWDYQAKAIWTPTRRDRFEVLSLGASNVVGEKHLDDTESVLQLGFHRLTTRWRHGLKKGWFLLGLEGGQEGFVPPPSEQEIADEPPTRGGPVKPPGADTPPAQQEPGMKADYRYLAVRGKLSLSAGKDVEIHAGADAELQDFGFQVPDNVVSSGDNGLTADSWFELEWSPGKWTVLSGVRVDHYRYGDGRGQRQTSIDPRLAVGLELTDWLTAKASAGQYHGPSRVTLVEGPLVIGPVPGMMGFGLEQGLSNSTQLSASLEARLPWRFSARLQAYYSFLHTAMDFSLMGLNLGGDETPSPDDPGAKPEDPASEKDSLEMLQTNGRSYGLEFMLRRKLGDSVFGWLTWSMARSERDVQGFGTLPFVFDQRHVLNGVVSWEVGRNWTLGATLHYHTGRPYTPQWAGQCDPGQRLGKFDDKRWRCEGEPLSGRLPGYWRLDVRWQKRELYDTWYFDYYVDIINATFNWETIGYELDHRGEPKAIELPLFVPMTGVRGRF